MPRLEFSHFHSYLSPKDEITLPIRIGCGTKSVPVVATIDTGASHCLFERPHGEWLGLVIESGERRLFRTAAGPVETFGHLVHIEAFETVIESMVYFFADPTINKNLLGRSGWLDRIRLGLVHYDRELYLAGYDS
jgi:hypothetical protein